MPTRRIFPRLRPSTPSRRNPAPCLPPPPARTSPPSTPPPPPPPPPPPAPPVIKPNPPPAKSQPVCLFLCFWIGSLTWSNTGFAHRFTHNHIRCYLDIVQ